MSRTITDSTLALAGVFQATALVQQAACQGRVNAGDFETCIRSIFELDPPSTEAVFGERYRLASGLRMICDQLGNRAKKDNLELTRYVITIMHLERKLSKRRQLLQALSAGIKKIQAQAAYFSFTHDNVIAALAELYVNTVSTLSPRIMVRGEQGYLTDPRISNRVRALLLAAMRAAVLWRQCGGTRLQLILQRKKLSQTAQRLLIV